MFLISPFKIYLTPGVTYGHYRAIARSAVCELCHLRIHIQQKIVTTKIKNHLEQSKSNKLYTVYVLLVNIVRSRVKTDPDDSSTTHSLCDGCLLRTPVASLPCRALMIKWNNACKVLRVFVSLQYIVSTQMFSQSVQLFSCVWLFATPWTAAHQASLSITSFQSILKLMSITSMMPSNHLILCHPLLLPPSIFPSIKVFSKELVLCIRWPKYWSFSFNISPSNEFSGLISHKMDWLELLAVQGTQESSNTTVQKHPFLGAQLSL